MEYSKKVEAANADVVEVSATYNLNAAIKGDGSLWMWGENYAGQIGDGTCVDRYVPYKLMKNVKKVDMGFSVDSAWTFNTGIIPQKNKMKKNVKKYLFIWHLRIFYIVILQLTHS